MKKIIGIILVFITILPCVFGSAMEINSVADAGTELKIGDYILLGEYYREPIVWRYVADDENGKLIWSDKILCIKPFGENNSYWEWSYIRTWLNSSAGAGDVRWATAKVHTQSDLSYLDEAGFMNGDNFSDSEKTVIKTVSLRNVLMGDARPSSNLHEYEEYYVYGLKDIEQIEGDREEFRNYESNYLDERIFLLDPEQLVSIQNNLAVLRNCFINVGQSKNVDEFMKSNVNSDRRDMGMFGPQNYWLRTPYPGCRLTSVQKASYRYGKDALYVLEESHVVGYNEDSYDFRLDRLDSGFFCGVRPAFYLNEETARIISGSGAEDDPYVIDGRTAPERFEENGLYGYKDAEGNVVIEAKYSKALPFSEGAALVALPENSSQWMYIDMSGEMLFEKAFYASNNFYSGYALVLVSDEPTYRYIDKTGEWANELVFEDAEDFDDGYARVKMDGKWGIVDAHFNFTIPCECETKEEAAERLSMKGDTMLSFQW